jgi:hypothetical protein
MSATDGNMAKALCGRWMPRAAGDKGPGLAFNQERLGGKMPLPAIAS